MTGVDVEVGGRLLLSGASFEVAKGDKVGLAGPNGAGKTSLMSALGGPLAGPGAGQPPRGRVVRQGSLAYLAQDPRQGIDERVTGLSHVLSGRGLAAAAAELEMLREAMETEASEVNIARFCRSEEMYRNVGGYEAAAEAFQIAGGLGLSTAELARRVVELSGGQRRRLELARVLFSGADILLLDEPTNHLDLDAKAWLMSFLRSFDGGFLVVSHDLALLDDVITRVLHLKPRGQALRGQAAGQPGSQSRELPGSLHDYKGTYSQYLEASRRDEEREAALAERRNAEVVRLSSMADSMRHQSAKRARVAKSLDKRVGRLVSGAPERQRGPRQRDVRLPPPAACGEIVLEAVGLSKSYDGSAVFEPASFTLGRAERMVIMGLNGAGKTTLLKMLSKAVQPDEGSSRTGVGVSTGYYAQEHEGITAGVCALDHMRQASPVSSERELRALLGMFGLQPEAAFQDAGTLSGGEKTKLALAQLVAGRHNLLLLDEPTNNLDPPSRTAVGRALAGWAGSIIVVSHEPAFVEELAPDLALLLPDAVVDRWRDDMAELIALA
ncbi:MAG: ABC-F family ATP-binding cassette domain-containing protein [Acidimicrobiales bacterium]